MIERADSSLHQPMIMRADCRRVKMTRVHTGDDQVVTLMMRIIIVLISISVFAAVNAQSLPRIKVDLSGRFRDDKGRQMIFHGINKVLKGFPWYDATLFNKTRLAFYKSWGFNSARIGCMWTGVAPQKGMYNETYLNITMQTVKLLEQFGIYSLLDMHQDVLTSKYGSYDGAPLWVIDALPDPTFPYPFPLTKNLIKKNWGLGYLTNAVAGAFQNIYDNVNGSLDHWGDFWVKVASTFKQQKSVIGYELINEPFAGNFYKNLEILLPGVAGKVNLQSVYDKLVPRIRSVDNDTLVFYEPVTWAVFDSGSGSLGTGFSHVPGGDSQRTKSVLSYHYYCWIISNPASNYTTVEKVVCDDILVPTVFPSIQNDLKRIGGGSFLTEFGLCQPDGNPSSKNTHECELVMNLADLYVQSWTYWDSQFFDANGQPRMDVVRAFARTYPRAVAGNITSINFDVDTAIFEFTYNIDTNIPASTEVFLPVTVHYKNGYSISISPSLDYSFNAVSSVVVIKNQMKGGGPVKNGSLIRVKIAAK